jgi:hypothetical protein
MGAWGVAAYDNDTAADWVFDKIKPAIDRALYSPYAQVEEVVAALAVAVDLDLVPWLAWDRVEAALARIEASDAKTGWKEPKARALYLKKLARKLEAGRKAAAWTPLTAMRLKKSKAATKKPPRVLKTRAKKGKA